MLATVGNPSDDGSGETVLGLASPFEGGECYNRDALLKTASYLGAEVVRIDLATAIGLSDSFGIKGTPAYSSKTDARCATYTGEKEPLVLQRSQRR